MSTAADGDTVRVHYVGTLASGAEFDSSRQREPMDVDIGAGNLIAPFEKALIGMAVGEVKTIVVPPEDGYGPRQEALTHVVAREQLPPELELREGMTLEATSQQGQNVQLRLVGFDEDRVVLDANHPLAGETLNFEIEMIQIDSGD